MSSDTLRERVARAMREAERVRWPGVVVIHDHHALPLADAAIGVVLAAVADEIRTLAGWDDLREAYPTGTERWLQRDDVLAVVARLGEDSRL